ncbi:MAG: hypothetical protein AB1644_12600 [Candidatus Zixiibacteriota bacterium]
MKLRYLLMLMLTAVVGTAAAQSDFYKKFKSDYASLDLDLLNNPCELGIVKDFVYQKDIATFTFHDGKMYLLRPIDGRPTTAIFIGRGSAAIDIPAHVERQCLWYASGDSGVAQDFVVCFIRMADDLDLRLKEKFTFATQQLDWKDFNLAKKAQGEFFFKPVIQHEYDNYFQLLRSAYERSADGYFWIDFNRYVFSFDPNRAEQTVVAYEKEGGAVTVTDGAVLQRKERGITDDLKMSDIFYPTTIIDRRANLVMQGMEGRQIDSGDILARLVVNTDSTRFQSLFLHYNLKLDSMAVDGVPVEFHRRRDFNFIGVMLPAYRHKGDTLDVRLWLHGKDFVSAMPYVENPAVSPHHLTISSRPEFNYLLPGVEKMEQGTGDVTTITVEPTQQFRDFQFQGYAPKFDTIPKTTETGVTVNFLKSRAITKKQFECFVPDETYQSATLGAFNYFAGTLGNPAGLFGFSVFPEGSMSMPGILEIRQVHCIIDGTGGFHLLPGVEMGRQYFGALMRPASSREQWLVDAAPEYLGLMYVQEALGAGPFYTELVGRKNVVTTLVERSRDLPLGTGYRVPDSLRVCKGAWVLHMLRFMMLDLEKQSDATFLKFLRELSNLCNSRTFTNADIVALAEKSYGQPLEWFFRHWLFERNIPEYSVEYTIVEKENGWGVDGQVRTNGVGSDFQMPVVMRVETTNGESSFMRQMITGNQDHFTLGPFAVQPKQLYFNEFYSVLSKDNVKKK